MVHACAITNHDGAGREIAELQLKSNRGVSQEVEVPGSPAYVWVDNQPWAARKQLAAANGFDPNRKVILPHGARMTIGYRRPAASRLAFWVQVHPSGLSMKDTFIRYFYEKATGLAADKAGWATQWTLIHCATGAAQSQYGWALDRHGVYEMLKCIVSDTVGSLANPVCGFR
jgi:hypothetical protein